MCGISFNHSLLSFFVLEVVDVTGWLGGIISNGFGHQAGLRGRRFKVAAITLLLALRGNLKRLFVVLGQDYLDRHVSVSALLSRVALFCCR